jgi:hypothetical protein
MLEHGPRADSLGVLRRSLHILGRIDHSTFPRVDFLAANKVECLNVSEMPAIPMLNIAQVVGSQLRHIPQPSIMPWRRVVERLNPTPRTP